MKKIVIGLARNLAELTLLGGAIAIAVGAGMIFLPAGLIAGGVLAIGEKIRETEMM